MKILDYETGRSLSDVGLQLTKDEAREMRDYLTRLLEEPSVSHAYLTEVSSNGIEKELAIAIDGPREAVTMARKLPLPRVRPLSVA